MKKQILSEEFKRMQKLAGIAIKENNLDNSTLLLANKYYNKFLSEYDPSKNFGDSTTFSGADDDIINGNYEDDSSYPNVEGFEVPEVATVYVTKDKDMAEKIKRDFEEIKVDLDFGDPYTEYMDQDSGNHIIIV